MAKQWDKENLPRENGEIVQMQVPEIISASRSTDIPAFYADWFFHRLKVGYSAWTNPFNGVKSYVSYKNTRFIVFWSKNPHPLLKHLDYLRERNIGCYIQYSLNDYEDEKLELKVPPIQFRIDTFKQLVDKLGVGRVIWRFDPLIITPQITPRDLLKRIWNIGNKILGCTEKLVFSFVDVAAYKKVQNNFVKETPNYFNRENVLNAEMTDAQQNEIVDGLRKCQAAWREKGWDITLATCAEQGDFQGVEHNRCIDGELIERICKDDPQMVYYLRTGKMSEPNLFGTLPLFDPHKMKDKGQRKICGCMISKDIGMYNTCRHFCVYCYANTSREAVLKNKDKHSDDSESIIN
jgi:DNA repair photolyase